MSVDLLIDGYNVMHFAGIARRKYGPQGLERARYRMLKRLEKGLTESERLRTVVVFDGTNSAFSERQAETQFSMEVVYSPQGLEADDVIEQMIVEHSSPKQLVVISSDNRLLKAARKRRAGCVDSESFLEELEQREQYAHDERQQRTPNREVKATDALSESELAEWLDVFEDVDPREISAEVTKETLKPTADAPSPPFGKTGTNSRDKRPSPTEAQPVPPPLAAESADDSPLPDDPLINDVSFWQQRIDEMYREEGL